MGTTTTGERGFAPPSRGGAPLYIRFKGREVVHLGAPHWSVHSYALTACRMTVHETDEVAHNFEDFAEARICSNCTNRT